MATEKVLEIIGGPNLWDLIIKAFAQDKRATFKLCIQTEEMHISLMVQGIEKTHCCDEIIDNHEWFIWGRVGVPHVWFTSKGVFSAEEFNAFDGIKSLVYFVASYSTYTRKGRIVFKIVSVRDQNPLEVSVLFQDWQNLFY